MAQGADRPRRGGAHLAAVALVVLAVAPLSCSDLAVKPRLPVKLTGVILDRDGAPMSGAELYFVDLDAPTTNYNPGRYYETETGQAGAYEIELPASRYSISVQPPFNSGYASARIPELALRSGPATFDYRFTGFKVIGTVTQPGGGPLNAGWANVSSDETYATAGIASGLFSLVLPAGTYRFIVGPPYSTSGIPIVTYFGVHVASDTTLAFSVDGHAVSGTVTGQAGQPLAGAYVRADGARAQANALAAANGTYVLYLPTGDYDWHVEPGNLNSYIVSREFPTTTITAPQTKDFDLSGVTWNGTVRLTGSGQSVPGARISVYGRYPYGSGYATSGPGGEFTFIVKPNGIYDLFADLYSPRLTGQVQGIQATNDSTFDVFVAPAGDFPGLFQARPAAGMAPITP